MITITVQLTKKSTTKKSMIKKKLQSSLKLISQIQSVTRRLISQNWSITLTVVVNSDEPTDLAIN